MKFSVKHVFVLLFTILMLCLSLEGKDDRPNFLIVLCDDLGYSDVGFNGAKDIKTPELDQLAKGGVVCSSGYVTHPFCGPSRMGLLSGRYPHMFGAPFNLPNGGHGIEEYNREGVDVDEALISTALKEAGYYTGAIGKWHCGMDQQFHPNTRGFDDFYGFLGGGHDYFPTEYQPKYERQLKRGVEYINDYLLPLEHNGTDVRETEYITDALSREAVRFVHEANEKNQPFFLYLAYNAPHSPLQAKDEDLAIYSGIKDEKRRTYAAMVSAVDRGVGSVVNALKMDGVYENTLIVFLSDNGGKLSLGATNHPLREGKGSAYEGGYRVPMFFHWPVFLEGGQEFKYPVSSLDFYPTFVSLAQAQVPEGKQLDGKNVMDALKVNQNPREGEMLYVLRHRGGYSDVGARQDQWKVCKVGKNARWKLFNIENDKGEHHDLSSQYPELLERMVSDVKKWSSGHTEPRWFHILKEGEKWRENEMPRFDETFKL